MRYHWLYILSFLTATPLANFAALLAPWDDMRPIGRLWAARPPGTTIDLYIALNPHQENALIDALYQVSDPKHPRHVHLTAAPLAPSFTYGAHLSKEQVVELVRPHPDTLELVTSWLAHHGVRPSSISTTHGGAWLTANEMLGASYQLYRHSKVNDTIIRTVSYALPEVLHAHIQAVAPTTYFASTRTLRQTSRRRSIEAAAALAEAAASGKPLTVLSSRAGEVTPSELRGLYKTFAYVPTAADRNTLGVFGYWKEYPSKTDLTMFMTDFRSDVQPPSLATFTVELVNGGGYDPDIPGDEANLDVQYATAMAYPTQIIFYSTGGIAQTSDSGEPAPGDMFLESLEYLLEKAVIPQTISISYGTYEWAVPQEYTTVLCTLFAQLGARGVSVLFPTGDDGVGKNCEDESGIVPISLPLAELHPTTPRSRLPSLEAAFRTYFPRPAYQDVAVSAFLERQGTQYAGLYNPGGRGIPDIAAQALKFSFFLKNVGVAVDGTSCSTPVCPRLDSSISGYTATGLRASTTSHLALTLAAVPSGFSAVPGWDPVTGLGTPDFQKLQNIFVPLGGQGNQPKIRGPAE
ncbi:subtilisin-like protein [Lactarius deliciosus]|nr:subtilisin-like protein [Lactarius deliciosus]